jgi:hypothetical protein
MPLQRHVHGSCRASESSTPLTNSSESMAHRIYPLLALTLFLHFVFAEEFNCKVTLSGREFDLTELFGPHNLTRTVTTTPSKVVQLLEFDLCDKLKRNNNPDSDQVLVNYLFTCCDLTSRTVSGRHPSMPCRDQPTGKRAGPHSPRNTHSHRG